MQVLDWFFHSQVEIPIYVLFYFVFPHIEVGSMASQRLENDIEQDFVKRLKSSGINCECFKFAPPGITGYPDRLIVLPFGQVLWIEFKRPGEEPRKLQDHRIERLNKLGHKVAVFTRADEAIDWVRFNCG